MNTAEPRRLVNGQALIYEVESQQSRYLVNGRPVSRSEWDALPKRMDWGAMTPPMTLPAWDPRSTVMSQGREMSRDEWNAVNKAAGLVEVSMRDMRLKQKPNTLTREVFSRIAQNTYAEMNRINL